MAGRRACGENGEVLDISQAFVGVICPFQRGASIQTDAGTLLTPLLTDELRRRYFSSAHAAVLSSAAPRGRSVSLDSRTAEQTRAEACGITIQDPQTLTQSFPPSLCLPLPLSLSPSDEAVMSGNRLIHLSLALPSIKLSLLYLTLSYSVSPRHSGCVESNSQNYNP